MATSDDNPLMAFMNPQDGGLGGSDVLSALGAGLLTGNRYQLIGPSFQSALAQAGKDADARRQRTALKAVLKMANPGLSDAQLDMMASDPTTAKLGLQAIETQAAAKAGQQASGMLNGLFGGGDGSTPAMTPPAPGGPAAGASLNGSNDEIQNRFVGALREGGLTNPIGLAAMAAYGQHESRYSPGRISGTWSDPSESGQAGTSGGLLSWRNERLDRMRAATAGAKDPVKAQARFALNENPQLTAALQAANTPEEANSLMADAWRFAGYDRPGGENAARLATTRSYLNRFAGGGSPVQVAASPRDPAVADDGDGGPVVPGQAPAQTPPAQGAGGPRPPAAPAPRRPVQIAENENDVQVLEGRMSMYPPSVYSITKPAPGAPTAPAGGTALAQADVPAPGAQPAEFVVPDPNGGPDRRYTGTTARVLASRAGNGQQPAAATPTFPLNDPAMAARAIPRLMQVLAIPNLPDAQKAQAKTALDYALGVVKPTDRTRQLMEAGYTPGTPEYVTAYRNLVNGDRTPMGYRLAQDGQSLEAIPGGPADPSNKSATKAPTGFRVTADGQSFEFVPGGPADPATISTQAQARQAGKPTAAPKPLPHNAVKDLSEAGASYGDFNRLTGGFKPEFGGWRSATLGDAANQVARTTGIGNTEAADWWADYSAKRNVVRNKLFGAALTSQEKSEFEKADITPGMTPAAIQKNLARQQQAATEAARKMGNYYLKAGRNPEEIEAALGIGLDELGLGANQGTTDKQAGQGRQTPASQAAPFARPDLEAEARRRGLIP